MPNRMLKYSLLLVLLLPLGGFKASPEFTTRSKTFRASYERDQVPMLLVENQLGNVRILTHTQPQVTVEVTLTATKQSESAAEATLAKLAIEETKTENMVALITEIDGDLNNRPGEGVSINYVIKVPADLPLNVSNSLGNLEVGKLTGADVQLTLEYGQIKVEALTGANARVEASFVNGGSLGTLKQGSLTLKHCQNLTIAELGQVDLEMEGTSLSVERAGTLNLDQEYGGLALGTVQELRGDASYGRLSVKELVQALDLSAGYAPKLEIKSIAPTARQVQLQLSYTSAQLNLAPTTRGQVSVQYQEGSFRWEGAGFAITKTQLPGGATKAQGTIGGGGDTRLQVKAEFGSLRLSQ